MANNGEIMFFENTLHHYGCYFHVYKIVHLLYVKNLTNLIGTQTCGSQTCVPSLSLGPGLGDSHTNGKFPDASQHRGILYNH